VSKKNDGEGKNPNNEKEYGVKVSCALIYNRDTQRNTFEKDDEFVLFFFAKGSRAITKPVKLVGHQFQKGKLKGR